MGEILQMKKELIKEMRKLQSRYELSLTVGKDYFEPGMEYMDQVKGIYDEEKQMMTIRFEAKGTRYDGRTTVLETAEAGDAIEVVRESDNAFNYNNFMLIDGKNRNMGNMPKELCNVIAPLYDCGEIIFAGSHMSFVAPLSKRNRHSKQGMFFVELNMRVEIPEELLADELDESAAANRQIAEVFEFLDMIG